MSSIGSVVVACVFVVACNSGPESRPAAPDPAPVVQEPTVVAPDPVAVASPPPVATPAKPAPSPNGDVIVVARLTNAGPIGDGSCTQRSYEIVIESVVAGEVPAPKDKRWVHFEQCGAAKARASGDLAGTGLKIGSTYRLTLHGGVSKNFGKDLMILFAEQPDAP